MYVELAHWRCAKRKEESNKQILDNIVLIVPELTGMHRYGKLRFVRGLELRRKRTLFEISQESELKKERFK
jgi:hypothetical protein